MNKTLTALAITAVLAMSGAAFSEDDTYFTLHAGAAEQRLTEINDPAGDADLTMDRDLMFGGAVGIEDGQARYEVELSRRTNDANQYKWPGGATDLIGGDFTTTTLMANGYYTFETNTPVKPFVTGGIGAAQVEANNVTDGIDTLDDSDTGFAYQVGIGVDYELSETVNLDAKYRYLRVNDIGLSGMNGDIESHEIMAGIRVNF